jgi:hypothetical protein
LHIWRPPYAYSNGIQQPPFCRPTGGREGFDSLGSSTPSPPVLRHLVTSSRDTLEAASSFGRRGVLARPGGLGTCGWDNVGRRTTRIPTRGRVTRVPTSDSESTSKSSPMVFGTTGRLGRPATDWWGTGTPRPPQRWHGTGTPRPPAQSAGEAISGPRYGPEGYIADNWLQTRNRR